MRRPLVLNLKVTSQSTRPDLKSILKKMWKRPKGLQSAMIGCKKRFKIRKTNSNDPRCYSDGKEDEETLVKRLFPRTFHR